MMYRFSGPPQMRWKSSPAAMVTSVKEIFAVEVGFFADAEARAWFAGAA
jgi:hypothetical protein